MLASAETSDVPGDLGMQCLPQETGKEGSGGVLRPPGAEYAQRYARGSHNVSKNRCLSCRFRAHTDFVRTPPHTSASDRRNHATVEAYNELAQRLGGTRTRFHAYVPVDFVSQWTRIAAATAGPPQVKSGTKTGTGSTKAGSSK